MSGMRMTPRSTVIVPDSVGRLAAPDQPQVRRDVEVGRGQPGASPACTNCARAGRCCLASTSPTKPETSARPTGFSPPLTLAVNRQALCEKRPASRSRRGRRCRAPRSGRRRRATRSCRSRADAARSRTRASFMRRTPAVARMPGMRRVTSGQVEAVDRHVAGDRLVRHLGPER